MGGSETTQVLMASQVLAFRCLRCGDCCTGWSVPVDGEFATQFEDQLRPASTGETLREYLQPPIPDSVQQRHVLTTRAGACTFLSPGQLCRQQERHGPGARPLACQVFPHRQVQLADSLSLSLDLSCRAAAGMLDRSFPPGLISHERQGLGDDWPSTELIDGLPISPPIFFAVEEALVQILEMTDVELDERLVAGSLLLTEVLRDIDRTAEPPPAGWAWQAELELRPAQKLRGLIRQARQLHGHPGRLYLLLGRLFDLVEQWMIAFDTDDVGPFWAETRQVRELFDIDADTAGWDERANRMSNRLAELWAQRETGVDRVLANYAWHLLLARHLTLEDGLVVGFRVLTVHYLLARLHTAAFAWRAGEAPAIHHAVQAVQVVERNFGHLPLLKRFWKRTSSINLLTDDRLLPQLLLLPDLETDEWAIAA